MRTSLIHLRHSLLIFTGFALRLIGIGGSGIPGLDTGVMSRLYPQDVLEASLQIGQVAKKTGLTVDAIRFYEKSGLLACPARTLGGYRLYHEREVADLEFIQKSQQLGFSLNEIRELFSIQRHPNEACAQVRDLIAAKLGIVRAKNG